MEDWKKAHDAAKEYIKALEESRVELRDQAIQAIKERDACKAELEELMRPPRWIA